MKIRRGRKIQNSKFVNPIRFILRRSHVSRFRIIGFACVPVDLFVNPSKFEIRKSNSLHFTSLSIFPNFVLLDLLVYPWIRS